MTTKLQEDSILLQNMIFDNSYYTSLYSYILARLNFNLLDISDGNINDDILINMWHDFYFTLPDSSDIQQEPFFKLCDILETN